MNCPKCGSETMTINAKNGPTTVCLNYGCDYRGEPGIVPLPETYEEWLSRQANHEEKVKL